MEIVLHLSVDRWQRGRNLLFFFPSEFTAHSTTHIKVGLPQLILFRNAITDTPGCVCLTSLLGDSQFSQVGKD